MFLLFTATIQYFDVFGLEPDTENILFSERYNLFDNISFQFNVPQQFCIIGKGEHTMWRKHLKQKSKLFSYIFALY